jgi:hypothetical protein
MTSGINSVGMTDELLQPALGNEPKKVLMKATEDLGQAASANTIMKNRLYPRVVPSSLRTRVEAF